MEFCFNIGIIVIYVKLSVIKMNVTTFFFQARPQKPRNHVSLNLCIKETFLDWNIQ